VSVVFLGRTVGLNARW